MQNNQKFKVVYYDGICNLCNGAVAFLLRADKAGVLHYASLQSKYARRELGNLNTLPYLSVYFKDGDLLSSQSSAVIGIAGSLPWPWKAAVIFKVLPIGLRDAIYRWIASHRYQWFGKRESCLLPKPEWKKRFLE